MINELHDLFKALDQVSIPTDTWAREYKNLPNSTKSKPCIRLFLQTNGVITEFEAVDANLAGKLRKFGNKQGTFPAFNIIPLYRVTDKDVLAQIDKMSKGTLSIDIDLIKSWCTNNNWGHKPSEKIHRCLGLVSGRLRSIIEQFTIYNTQSMLELIGIAERYEGGNNPGFREAIENCVIQKLSRKEDAWLDFFLLFHRGDPKAKDPEDDRGSLSVILDLYNWQEYQHPIGSVETTSTINKILTEYDNSLYSGAIETGVVDAFGTAYTTIKKPMPTVKLPGFEASIRTMFSGQPCQSRYRTIEGESYPLAHNNRTSIQSALAWIADPERRLRTWTSFGKDELVFIYPSKLSAVLPMYAGILGSQRSVSDISSEARFEQMSSSFISVFNGLSPAEKPKHIQIFSIRKMDKARTKVVYTRSCSADQYIEAANEWEAGCKNLPVSCFGEVFTPFPLAVSTLVNTVWNKNGEIAGAGKPLVSRMKYYQGLDLMLNALRLDEIRHFLTVLLQNAGGLVEYIGNLRHRNEHNAANYKAISDKGKNISQIMSVLGLLLYKCGTRKEQYMEETAYLLGQTLKISDELHALYCKVVRGGDLPPQLVGSALFTTALETPLRAFSMLGSRMSPYITWAKQYRAKGEDDSRLAGWCLRVYQSLFDKLNLTLTPVEKFDDYGKSKLFIGYMASFPRKEKEDQSNGDGDQTVQYEGESLK